MESDEDDDFGWDVEDFVRPTQQSLDELAEQLREIQVCEWVLEGRALRPVALLRIQDPERLAAFMAHLRIVESDEWQHCMCVGSLAVVAVTNEVGQGVVPESASGRRFRDVMGRLNAAVAAETEDVRWCVAGRVTSL